jgi:hypothetical protein
MMARMAVLVVDPTTLIGDQLSGVVMGSSSAYFLRFGSGVEVRAAVSDDAALELVVDSAPNASEIEAIDQRDPIADVIGHTIIGVDRVWWLGGGGIGLRLRVDNAALVIAVDEVRGRYEVAILDGDIGEDWGREPIA